MQMDLRYGLWFGIVVSLGITTTPVPGWTDIPHTTYAFSEAVPEVLVGYPFPCSAPGAPNDATTIAVLIDQDGFVLDARFEGRAPTDSAAISAGARRWIYRPLPDYPLPPGQETRRLWIRMPLRTACAREGGRYPPPKIEAPDSSMRARLLGARRGTAYRILPPTAASLERVRAERGTSERFEESWILDRHGFAPDSIGADLVALLNVPGSRAGAPPWEERCVPETDLALVFAGKDSSDSTVVRVSFSCDFLEVRTGHVLHFAPFRPLRDRFLALARRLFPADPAFAGNARASAGH